MTEFFLGSDVSKGYCDFVILDDQEQVVLDNFQLDDTRAGHNHLKAIVVNLFNKYKKVVLYVGLESTGGYENNWFKFFSDLSQIYNIKLSRVSATGVFHYIKSSQRKISTDKESARGIGEYLVRNKKTIRFNEYQKDVVIKKQWTFVKILVKQQTQLKNQLEKHLYIVQPQLLKYDLRVKPEWFFSLILKYPTAQKLSRASVKSISKIPYITESKAEKLKDDAKQSVASLDSEASEFLTVSIISQIIALKNTIKIQKESLHKTIEKYKSAELALLKSFTGIGSYSASGLLLEIGDIKRFPSAKKLASFFGLHPIFRQSGDITKEVRMSKQGSREARYLLFNIVMSGINYNAWLKELYVRYQKKGKPKLSAIGILMHKVARIIYGMLINKTKYDAEIDKKNIERSIEKKVIPTEDKNRRFQKFDSDAPISSRHKKKRDEQLIIKKIEQMESQNDKII